MTDAPESSARIRFRRWRVRQAIRLFKASRAARTAFILVVWPFAYLLDRLHGVEPPARLRDGLHWARTGESLHVADWTATQPASKEN